MTDAARPLRAVPEEAAAEDQAAAEVARARAALPALDPAVFDCYLGSLARELEPTTEADPVAVLASLLCAAGVHLGQGPHVQAGDDVHPLLVWPLLVGRTSAGRKGTSWSTAKRLLDTVDTDFCHDNVRSGLTSGEGLAAMFTTSDTTDSSDTSTPDPDPDAPPARHDGPRDLRLLVMEPEWAGVMAKMKREGNSLSAILRAAWEGGDLSTLTVTARIAPSSHVGILAHITPGEFRSKVSASDMAGGTYNRFLPLAVARSKFLPFTQGAPSELISSLAFSFSQRLAAGARLRSMVMTGPAADLWRKLYVEFGSDHGDTGPVEQFISRAAPTCLRIAAIHAALDTTSTIEPNHLHAAAALVRYSIASARAVFTDTHTPARLAAWIAEAGETGRTRKDITTGFFKGKTPAEDITAMLHQLIEAGHITRTTRPRADGKPGRGAEIYTAREPTTRT
ncbi:Protein of unknown function [Haloechinothrix alba]|uniref:DUF3987 domain-containing protein n=1 Tax=Haloechinothrix alba TaxID=664784 RepID=A0A238ZV74_9PSEU|nr:DUF3987 domain-containing protein [Haloechinothrix alba]SNR87356.1 Protein of unknown function [Haloechinothrix alba]